MKSLLLIAHGSRVQASNDEIAALTGRLRGGLKGSFDHVEHAFLELAEPDIPTGIDYCVDAGATEIVALPYFLSAGRHITEDIPREIAKREPPGVRIRLADYIGRADGMLDFLLRHCAQDKGAACR